jgi:predicted transcriptional regulator
MKLRLDRVLKIDLAGLSQQEVLSAGEELPEFKKPAKWTAPYGMYTPGWWKVFYPQQ